MVMRTLATKRIVGLDYDTGYQAGPNVYKRYEEAIFSEQITLSNTLPRNANGRSFSTFNVQ